MTKPVQSSSNQEQKNSVNNEQETTERDDSKQSSSPQVYRFRFMPGACKAQAAQSSFQRDDFDRGPGPIF